MTSFSQKIEYLNQTTLESFNESKENLILKRFTQAGIKILDASFGFAWFKKATSPAFELAYKSPGMPYKPREPRRKGSSHKVMASQKALLITDLPKNKFIRDDAQPFVKSLAVIPISYKGRIYGSVYICFSKRRAFTRDDQSLCTFIGNSAAQAITINRFYENLENLVEQRTRALTKEIIQRKQTEEELRQSQHFTEQISNVTPGMITVYNITNGNYIYVNSAIKEILGFEPKDFLQGGLAFATPLIHPKDAADITKKNQRILEIANRRQASEKDNAIVPFEYRMKHKNGSWRWLNTYGTIFNRGADGKVEHVLNISVDITERKQMESRLQTQTEKLQQINQQLGRDKAEDEAILSSIGEGLLATDTEGRVILINPAAEKMLGWSSKEIMGKTLYDFQPLFDEKNQIVPLEQRPTYGALVKGQQVTVNNFYYPTKQGKTMLFSITATPVRLDGKIVGSIQVFRDISKEREIDKAKSELISLASHQLRTPLSGINWYVEALIKEEVGKLNKDQKKYLQGVYHANQKLVELVYDFLNVSRIELGTFNIKLSTVDITEVVKGILNELQPLVAEKKLSVKQEYKGKLQGIRIDHKIIRLVLQNIITNAAKYTPVGGKISIAVTMNGNGEQRLIKIVITDTGVGIPKKDQGKIFSKLFRADNIKQLDADGTGLGLYIVKSFIELCNGKIWFKSRENAGTTFFVELPVPLE